MEWQVGSIAIGTRSIKNPFTIRPRALRDNPFLNLSLHLLGTLRFRCALARIDVHLVDETNTSRIDALGMEPVAGSGPGRRQRNTGRLTRKEYRSTTGAAIHRDINAAINIGRLVFGDSFAEPILKGRQWEHPDVEFIEIGGEGIFIFNHSGIGHNGLSCQTLRTLRKPINSSPCPILLPWL